MLHSPMYLWTAPVWLAWYLCAVRSGEVREEGAPIVGEHEVTSGRQGKALAIPALLAREE